MRAARGTGGDVVSVLKAGDLCILAARAGKTADVDQVLQTEETGNILQIITGDCLVYPGPGLCLGYRDRCRGRGRSKISLKFSIKFGVGKHVDFFVVGL